ncbi:MAG TPA: hypothetical protein VKA14_04155 [Gammaproteobacteria bacterium]|nr:hypothetical protein [Gammaproteobacteria bacterium]
MDDSCRKLLAGALEKHRLCTETVADVNEKQEILRQLVEVEEKAWSESALEVENRPMIYRHLLSHLDDLGLVEERYSACEHDYLKAIAAQRYAELLGTVDDMAMLMELAVRANPGLRSFVILRLQEKLPMALEKVSAQDIPKWFLHLLAQPHEVSNFLSQASCRAVMDKVEVLLAA